MRFTSVSEIESYFSKVTNYEKQQLPKYTSRKYNLITMKSIMSKIGNPHKRFKSIHIAGSCGKGSVCHILDEIYLNNGYKTGRYISPHIVSILERICVNGIPVSDELFVSCFNKLFPVFDRLKPTFFEIMTSMAFYIFALEKVDIAIVEVGLGGRLDCTNIITPEVSVITRIEVEHKKILGPSISKIAKEKAGIIKRYMPVVAFNSRNKSLEIVKQTAKQLHSKLSIVDEPKVLYDKNLNKSSSALEGLNVTIQYEGCSIPFAIASSLALQAVKIINGKFPVNESRLPKIIAGVKIPGRMTVLKTNPPTILDTAHSYNAIKYLFKSIKNISAQHVITICTFLKDKEVVKMMREIYNNSDIVIVTKMNMPRQYPVEKLKKNYRNILITESVDSALKTATKIAQNNSIVIFTGSSYLVGEITKRSRLY